MKIKNKEPNIPENNPFANCKLDRRQYADILTNIVDSYSSGFVLAVNNKWGTGKTTFVKMWAQDLRNKEHKTVYFNAWENDFEDNPLTALMGELKTLTTESTEPEFKNILKKAALLSKNITPVIVQAIVDKYIDTKIIKDGILGVTEGLSDIFENDVNEYAEKKKSIYDFKKSLSKFINSTYKDKPLVFIIDELDRCRPNYAVSILEQIKHFFSVPNIVFVLSIDKIQLGNAVKGVYGSDSLDSDEYLRRFIDIEYSIPEPSPDAYYRYLFDYYSFRDFFNSTERIGYRHFQQDEAEFLQVSKLLFTNRNIPLRQQEKIYGLARLALRSFNPNNHVVPFIFLFLAFIKITDNDFYNDLKNRKLTLLEAQNKFLSIIEPNKSKETEYHLLCIESYLVVYYHNYINSNSFHTNLFEFDKESNSNKLLIDSVINKEKHENFLRILESIYHNRLGELSLGYFIKKIELLDELKS